jgi:hypothetical protein
MYAERELTVIAEGKTALRQRIARHRLQTAQAVTRVTQPLAWLDRTVAQWRKLSPFAALAAVPLGFLLKRRAAPRLHLLGTLLRWSPLLVGAVRSFSALRRPAGSR